MKREIVINRCFGGFNVSDLAYEELIKLGIPVREYEEEPSNPKTGLYDIRVLNNEGRVIFDRKLTTEDKDIGGSISGQRYWDIWIDKDRENPLLIKVVKKLGKKASGFCANLKIVKIPDDIEYKIEEYDGLESVEEKHKSWN